MMMKNNHAIYCHTLNGKIYIGQTFGDTEKERCKRFQHGNGYKGCKLFYNAIKKHGWGNVTTEWLFTDLSSDEANLWEQLLIRMYDATNHEIGYNITLGGGGKNLGMNCHGNDYRKKERNEHHKRVLAENPDKRKDLYRRQTEHRRTNEHYKEYQREWYKKKREAYLQSDEYKEKQMLAQEIEAQRVKEREEIKAKRIIEKEKKLKERRRLVKIHKQQAEQQSINIHNQRIELVKHRATRDKVMRRVHEQIRRANTLETKEKWRKELEYLKSIQIID